MWGILIGAAELGLLCWGANNLFGDGKNVKTTRRYKNVFGNRVADVKYHDSGRRVKHVTGRGIFGDKVTRSYEIKKGSKKCFRCGWTVARDGNGAYHCCGRTFY